MSVFESEEGVWPIRGWESRSHLDAVLRQYDLKKKFDFKCRNHRTALKARGESPTARRVLEDCIVWIGAGEGPQRFMPTVSPVPPPGKGKKSAAPNKRERVRLREDIEWVYLALGGVEGKEGLPPSKGAKVLLDEARKDTHWFLQSVWSKLLPKVEAEKPEVERFGEDGRPLAGLERAIADKLGALNAGVSQVSSGESGVPPMAARLGPRVTREA